MGSTSNFTPRFSTQVSPSWTASSNSNPYCRPEQPPPCTNTRSIRFGLPSPLIRSPTLRAAASVNSSVGASVSTRSVVLISLTFAVNRLWSVRVWSLACRLVCCSRDSRPLRNPGQLTHDLRTQRHFNDPVEHISLYPGGRAEHHTAFGHNVTLDGTVQHNVRGLDRSLDGTGLAHGQARLFGGIGTDVPRDAAVEVQATGKLEVAMHL